MTTMGLRKQIRLAREYLAWMKTINKKEKLNENKSYI